MNDSYRKLFIESHRLAVRVAARLKTSIAKLQPLFPLSTAQIDTLDDADQEALDAFLKRFEQMVDLLENRMFRGLAVLEGEDLAEKSKRDITLLMEKLGVIGRADGWTACSILRNKLTHDYPASAAQRAERINSALAATPSLFDVLRGVEARVRSRRLADLD